MKTWMYICFKEAGLFIQIVRYFFLSLINSRGIYVHQEILRLFSISYVQKLLFITASASFKSFVQSMTVNLCQIYHF